MLELKGTVSREKFSNWDCGEEGLVQRMCQIRILNFYYVPSICYVLVYLKMAPIEVKLPGEDRGNNNKLQGRDWVNNNQITR